MGACTICALHTEVTNTGGTELEEMMVKENDYLKDKRHERFLGMEPL